jgi:hypothetical protein
VLYKVGMHKKSYRKSFQSFFVSLLTSAFITFFILLGIFFSFFYIRHDRQNNLNTSLAIQKEKNTKNNFHKIYYGVYLPGVPADISPLTSYETEIKKPVSLVLWYQQWGTTGGKQNFQQAWMDNVRNHGSIPYVTWEPWIEGAGSHQPEYSLTNIINGNFDAYITQWAQASKTWDHPYFLRFAHEMNADWYPWDENVNGNTSGQYVKAWIHVHNIFAQNGVTNVTWVWCPNVQTNSTSLSNFYPGDAYVDWTCSDGYNWGTAQPHTSWESFDEIFGKTYKEISSLSSKPMMIGETASAEQGGNKADWITTTFTTLPTRFPNIKAITWFDINKETDWRTESSTSSQNAFAYVIKLPIYARNDYINLNQTPIAVP